ncbi:MAG: thiamine pyrophosphate-binding protein, partial [Pseudomonadota bacterium]|nr:thiamine pyrophosphate-binding protein [Pseudomonadota bacterium]
MPHTTIAELVVETLIANGISQLYCLPGVQNDGFFDRLFDHTDRITPIQTRHEQGAAYMATGASLATGQPQAFCVVPGPGFLNTTAALSTAWAVNAPVLALAGRGCAGRCRCSCCMSPRDGAACGRPGVA